MPATCPYCRAPLDIEEELATCIGCGTVHHADCLAENGGCTVFGCSQAPVEEAKISVTRQETNTPYPIFQPPPVAPAAPYSFLNLQNPALPSIPASPGAYPIAPPPPPYGAMTIGPPPPPDGAAPYPAMQPPYSPTYPHVFQPETLSILNPDPQQPYTPTFAGYAPPPYNPDAYGGYYAPRKSRVVFVLMAIFLGPFGGHNFYAGYTTKAIIQLCLTVLTCFIGSFVSWIWAIVEACVVDSDSDGVSFV